MDCAERNRIVSLDDMERFINNFKCQQCLSLGSYIMTEDLFQWIDQSIDITFKCQNCSMLLMLKESNIIEIQTPGCISKTISRNLIQFARAATVIGLSFSQIEKLLQSLEIPSPTISIWKTSVEIACGRNKSCFTDPTDSQQINEVEQIRNEAHSHNFSLVKSEEAIAVGPTNEVNFIMIKEEPPEVELKEEIQNLSNMELFMEWNDEVIVPDVVELGPLNSIRHLSQQVTKEDMSDHSDVVDAACNEGSSSHKIETIYIKERNSQAFTSIENGSAHEINCQRNANEITQKRILKKRHIMTPKRYREDFYCEDVVKRIRSKNKYALKNRVEIDKNLVSNIKTNKEVEKNVISDLVNNEKSISNVESNKEIENNFISDLVNNELSTSNIERITNTHFDILEIICALCGGVCNYSQVKYSFSSLILGFESITVKVAMQILNLLSTSKNPRCQNICSSCFDFISSKFKLTLRKKIAEEKNIDISKVELSKIKVRMFDHHDKKNIKSKNSTHSKETASPTSSYVTRLHHDKIIKFNSANKVKLRRIKHLSKKKGESFSRQMLENPYLIQKLKTEAISFHPIIRLMDISPILPSEAFDGASVLVNSKSDILQFC